MAGYCRRKSEQGNTTLGYMLASVALLGVVLLLLEFYKVYTVKQNIDIELSRAVNIALDLSMMDIYRRDHVLVLDEGVARDSFFSYLHTELNLDGNLVYRDEGGKEIFELDIETLFIQGEPPIISMRGSIVFRPTYFGNMYLGHIRFPVRAGSHNKRILD